MSRRSARNKTYPVHCTLYCTQYTVYSIDSTCTVQQQNPLVKETLFLTHFNCKQFALVLIKKDPLEILFIKKTFYYLICGDFILCIKQ